MAGSDDHDVEQAVGQGSGVEAVRIDRQRHDLGAVPSRHAAQRRVPRILHAHREPATPSRAECGEQQAQPLARARSDDDVGIGSRRAAHAAQVLRDLGSELGIPEVGRVEMGAGDRLPPGRPPGGGVDRRGVRRTGGERTVRSRVSLCRVGRPVHRADRPCPRAEARCRRPPARSRVRLLQARMHPGTAAVAGREVPLGDQLLVRGHHHSASHAEPPCQLAGCGDRFAGAHRPQVDRLAQGGRELGGERDPGCTIQGDGQLGRELARGDLRILHGSILTGVILLVHCNS